MNQKKGQLFILAAVIISVVIAGLGVSYNVIYERESPENFYDLVEEIKLESYQVIDYDVVNPGQEELPNFSKAVGEYALAEDVEIVVLYGDENSMTVSNYLSENIDVLGEDLSGGGKIVGSKIGLDIGGTAIGVEESAYNFNKEYEETFDLEQNKNVRITVGKNDYDFNLKEGKQFFLIARRTTEIGDYVGVQ